MLVQMPMRVLMDMLVGMGCFAMPMLMAMRVGMLMNMQVVMFRFFCHSRIPFPKICFDPASSDVNARVVSRIPLLSRRTHGVSR